MSYVDEMLGAWGDYTIEDEAMYGIWTTNNGEQIPVENMTTSHIKNTIAYLERRDAEYYEPWIDVFSKELERREVGQ